MSMFSHLVGAVLRAVSLKSCFSKSLPFKRDALRYKFHLKLISFSILYVILMLLIGKWMDGCFSMLWHSLFIFALHVGASFHHWMPKKANFEHEERLKSEKRNSENVKYSLKGFFQGAFLFQNIYWIYWNYRTDFHKFATNIFELFFSPPTLSLPLNSSVFNYLNKYIVTKFAWQHNTRQTLWLTPFTHEMRGIRLRFINICRYHIQLFLVLCTSTLML